MENEEKKDVCCGEKVGCCEGKEKCEHGMANCCHNWKKCHMIKWIVIAVALVVAFCLGTQWGEMRSESRNYRFERGGMMNWGEGRFENRFGNVEEKTTSEVTVEVNKTPEAPKQ